MSRGADPDATAPMLPRRDDDRDLAGSVGERYQVLERIGRGATADVYLGVDHRLHRRVALKAACHPDGAALLIGEAAALARIAHPNVVAVHDLAHVGAQPLLVLELVDGPSLDRWRIHVPTWASIVDAFAQAAEGLAAAHAGGVIHRDVKPANLLRDHRGRVRVADFGVALATGLPCPPGVRVGTLRYMAPEQRDGHADAASDQFGLGVSLFEALYGFHPYGDPPDLDGAVTPLIPPGAAPAALAEIVLRAIALDRARRWPSMTALADALTATLPAPRAPPRSATPAAYDRA